MDIANPDLEGLYRRAAAEPQSMTRAERNIIFDRPPPDEEDRICIARTGHTLANLLTKASSSPDCLTFQEAKIVSDRKGVHFDAMEEAQNLGLQEILARNELRRRRYMNPSALEALLDEAQRQLRNSVEGEEKTALRNASDRWYAIEDAEMNAIRRREEDLLRARRLKMAQVSLSGCLSMGCLGMVRSAGVLLSFARGAMTAKRASRRGGSSASTLTRWLKSQCCTEIVDQSCGPGFTPSLSRTRRGLTAFRTMSCEPGSGRCATVPQENTVYLKEFAPAASSSRTGKSSRLR